VSRYASLRKAYAVERVGVEDATRHRAFLKRPADSEIAWLSDGVDTGRATRSVWTGWARRSGTQQLTILRRRLPGNCAGLRLIHARAKKSEHDGKVLAPLGSIPLDTWIVAGSRPEGLAFGEARHV